MTDEAVVALVRTALCEAMPNRAPDFAHLRLDDRVEELGIDSLQEMEMVGSTAGGRFPSTSRRTSRPFFPVIKTIICDWRTIRRSSAPVPKRTCSKRRRRLPSPSGRAPASGYPGEGRPG